MYALVSSLDLVELRRRCVQTFGEMRDAGFTTVGEFHYLHHDQDEDYAFDEVVLAAAAQVGIRIVLLQAYYATGGIGKPLEGAQRRFRTQSLEEFWRQLDRLERLLDPATQTLGVAPHSVRAVGLDEIAALHREARRRRLPFHLHVEEQRREIEESLAAYGRTPMAAILDTLGSGDFTAVHCTHTAPADMARFLDAGGMICACPLTEGNLGDGIPRLEQIHARGGRLCVGTDSNLRLSALEEMRWLEYGQRLYGELRGALAAPGGNVAPTLLGAVTTGGAAALQLETGRIAPGCWADLVALDLDAAPLENVPPERLLEAAVFGAGNEIVAGTFVGGQWRATGA
jgi:formimidoylglutamate deiminase